MLSPPINFSLDEDWIKSDPKKSNEISSALYKDHPDQGRNLSGDVVVDIPLPKTIELQSSCAGGIVSHTWTKSRKTFEREVMASVLDEGVFLFMPIFWSINQSLDLILISSSNVKE